MANITLVGLHLER